MLPARLSAYGDKNVSGRYQAWIQRSLWMHLWISAKWCVLKSHCCDSITYEQPFVDDRNMLLGTCNVTLNRHLLVDLHFTPILVSGSAMIHCDGVEWSSEIPNCIPRFCDLYTPQEIEHSVYIVTELSLDRSKAQYTCNEGVSLTYRIEYKK